MSSAPDQYGVFGHPVAYSLSPVIHGMFARATGQNMSYRLYDVAPQEFAERVGRFFAEGGRGLNITQPHKIAALAVAHELTARAAHAAAVNTLALQGERLVGDNTDGIGLVRDLCSNHGIALARRRVLMLGAGGATRGLLAALLELEPAIVVIANRTPERAEALAAAFAGLGATRAVGFAHIGDTPYDLIVNATSASLAGEIPPIPLGAIGRQTVCYDLAYGHSADAFLSWAERAGCARALPGLGMLVEQAAESFRLWRGVRPQTAHVLAALRSRSGV